MILKISCPGCHKAYRLTPPYPPAGKRYRCTCGKVITVTYPSELMHMVKGAPDKAALSTGVAPADHGPVDPSSPSGSDQREAADTAQHPPVTTQRDHPNQSEGRRSGSRGSSVPHSADAHQDSPGLSPSRSPVQGSTQSKPADQQPTPSTTRQPDGLQSPTRGTPGASSVTRQEDQEATQRTERTRPPLADTADTHKTATLSRGEAHPRLQKRTSSSKAGGRAVPTRAEGDTAGSSTAPPSPAPKKGRTRWLRRLLIAFGSLGLVGAAVLGGVLYHYSRNLPSIDSLRTYEPPVPSQVFARDGTLIAEFYGEERRYPLTYDEIPEVVIHAFVAAEDATFFEHHGIDYLGIARAAITNIKEHRMAQGASTITQQVARSFLLTREKKLERKIIEALLAYRVENTFSKEHILYLYLNQIYLGEGAYGVQAASRVYYGRDVDELSLAEVALMAGLCPAPSRYSPLNHFKAAKDRQRYVLHSMARAGYITQEEAETAGNEPLALINRVEASKSEAPYISEHIRRYLVSKYGNEAVLTGGLKAYTTIDLNLQRVAQTAVWEGVRRIDRRIGYRGPIKTLPASEFEAWKTQYDKDLMLKRQKARPGGLKRWGPPPEGKPPLAADEIHQGLVLEANAKYARVAVGTQEGLISHPAVTWAYKPNPKRSWKHRTLNKVSDALHKGDLINVRIIDTSYSRALVLVDDAEDLLELHIEQEPAVEGGLFSYSVEDGSVIAMVGGYDFARSEFNRPMQAKRQMGSAFKPLIYAAALDHPDLVFTPATMVLDAPITLHKESEDVADPLLKELWKPSNYGRDYLGEIMLRKALFLSRNTVAVKLLSEIGLDYAYDYVRKFGIVSPLNKDTSMVLGTSSVTLFEMCRAYSAFANYGRTLEPIFIDRVEDRYGNILEKRPEKPVTHEVMPPSTAYIMTHMLRDVVRQGTATKARVLGKITAGKTGTTNDFVDASYLGFTPQVVTGTWAGYDQPQSMGYGQTGGDAALPMWIAFMREAMKVYPKSEYETPEDVVYVKVDLKTGKLAHPSATDKVRLPFLKGEEPTEMAPEPGQIDTMDFLSADQAL